MPAVQTGAAGEGFIASTAGPLLLLAVAVALIAVPAIREALVAWAGSLREHLVGPADDTAAETGTGPETTVVPAARASDRDEYDFDLDVLTEGDRC